MRLHFFPVFLLFFLAASYSASEENRVAEITKLVSEVMYEYRTRDIAEQLRSSGLSPDEAETTEKRVLNEAAVCYMNAVISVAEEGSASMDTVLDALESSIAESKLITVGSTLNEDLVTERAMPCLYDISQQAGLTHSWDAD